MNFLSNLVLGAYVLSVILLLYLLFGTTVPRVGDAGMGYAWLTMILNLAILLLSVILYFIMSRDGSLDRISPHGMIRGSVIFCSITLVLFCTAICSVFRFQVTDLTGFVKTLCSGIPILNLIVLTLFLTTLKFAQLTPGMVSAGKAMMIATIAINIGTLIFFQYSYNRERKAEAASERPSFATDEKLNHARKLKEIEQFNAETDMVFLLGFSDSQQPDDIREDALAKIKSHPHWESELLRILGTGYYEQALTFIASNGFDHPELFVQPVYKAIMQQSDEVRKTLRNAHSIYDLYPEQFSWQTDRILRTVDRMTDPSAFVPAIDTLRAAFEEGSPVQKPAFQCRLQIDRWLKRKADKISTP